MLDDPSNPCPSHVDTIANGVRLSLVSTTGLRGMQRTLEAPSGSVGPCGKTALEHRVRGMPQGVTRVTARWGYP